MTILYKDSWYWALIIFCLFSFLVLRRDFSFTKWVEKYWFLRPNKTFFLSKALYTLSILGLIVLALDFRGPEETVETSVKDQKTVILIDTSSSMLVEDIRPNRFRKSIMMARHFVKKAFGHQISLVLFSDIQKKVVPFTDDLDLLDARLASLESLNISKGGSRINSAIVEAAQYLSGGKQSNISGNILVFTDSEENGEQLDTSLLEDVRVAIIGVGTARGGVIPIRTRGGNFIGNKRHNGTEIISKLDEGFLKRFGKDIPNYRYWIANSYSLPTEKIMKFFEKGYKETAGAGLVKIRPVKGVEYILIGILALTLSQFLFLFKGFKHISLIILIGTSHLFMNDNAFAQEQPQKKELPPLSQETLRDRKSVV